MRGNILSFAKAHWRKSLVLTVVVWNVVFGQFSLLVLFVLRSLSLSLKSSCSTQHLRLEFLLKRDHSSTPPLSLALNSFLLRLSLLSSQLALRALTVFSFFFHSSVGLGFCTADVMHLPTLC